MMEKLARIEMHLKVAEERDRQNGDLISRLVDSLEGIRATLNRIESKLDRMVEHVPGDAPTSVNQGQLIRWLAFAVVLASLGSKALELLARFVPAIALP